MRRRPEAYHQRLRDSAAPPPTSAAEHGGDSEAAGSGSVASIHAVVRSREAGLADRLQYDGYERRSGLVHLFAPGTTREAFARAEAVELGDAHDGAYDILQLSDAGARFARDVRLPSGQVVHVEKRFVFDGNRRDPSLGLEVTVENRSEGPVAFDLGIEWALMMLGGGGNPAAYYETREPMGRIAHDSAGELAAAEAISSGNTYIGVDVVTSFDPPAKAWWTPIETVSNSEYGFERIYQGSALVGVWPVQLSPGDRRTVRVTQLVATDRDRSADS
jgi:alpha-amylase